MSIAESGRRRTVSYLRAHTNPPVFLISAGVILAFLIVGAAAPRPTKSATDATMRWIATYAGWFYLLATTLFLLFVVVVVISPWGGLRLGPADSKPKYGIWSWLAMVFTAGMGVGLVYYGVYEPVYHLEHAPISADRHTEQAATEAMNFSFYHWGLHAWAIYAVLGLAMGFLHHRHNLPLRPSSVLYPLIGDRIRGWAGKLVDILAVFVTVFGLATSLGLGAQQIRAGLGGPGMFELPDNLGTTIVIALLVTIVAAISLVLGIRKGISRVSVFGIGLTALFLAFIFVVGPTRYLFRGMVEDIGFYLQNLLSTSTKVYGVHTPEGKWQADWTLFNWGWWLCWAPFVGMFLAEISRGRTLRQFIVGTVFVPAGICILWFSILGGTALFAQQHQHADLLPENELALFTLLDKLPIGELSKGAGVVALMLVVLYFAPSLSAGSLVVDRITSREDQDSVKWQRLGWMLSAFAVATVLLVVGHNPEDAENALKALRDTAVAAGLPIAVLLLIACGGLVKVLLTARE